MSNRPSDTSGPKSDQGNRTSIGSSISSQKPQQAAKPGSTTSSTTPVNRSSTTSTSSSTVVKAAPKPTTSFAAAAGGKAPAHVPVRTNSAPPEEHPSDAPKPGHFIPTKTTNSIPSTEPVSYRSALGVKAEPAKAAEKPTEPEKPAAALATAQPEAETAPTADHTTQAGFSSTENANTQDNADSSSAAFNQGGDSQSYNNRNSNRMNSGDRQSNPRRNMPRSDSYGGSGSMNSNRGPRNPQNNQPPPQMNPQYAAAAQQQQQYQQYYQQVQVAQAQQQQQMMQYILTASLSYPLPQFQQYLSTFLPAEYVAAYVAQYPYLQQQAQALAYQQQYFAAAQAGRAPQYAQAVPQYPQQATMMAAGGGYYAYPQQQPGVPVAMATPQGYAAAPKLQVDETTGAANPVAAPIYQSSPVINSTPVVTGTPSTQTPVTTAKAEPEVPPPVLQMPPRQEVAAPVPPPAAPVAPAAVAAAPVVAETKPADVKPPLPEQPRRQLKITTKTGEVWKPEQVVAKTSTPVSTTSQPSAETPSVTEATPKTEEGAKKEETKEEAPAATTAPVAESAPQQPVDNSIPDMPVTVRAKKRSPTVDETVPAPATAPATSEQPPAVEKTEVKAADAPPSLEQPPGLGGAAPADPSAAGRRLVAGNKLSHSHFGQPANKKVYTKAEIMALKPIDAEVFAKNLMGSINLVNDGPGGGRGGGAAGAGYPRGGGRNSGGGAGGAREGRGGDYGRGDGTPTGNEPPGWTREALPPIQTGKKGKGDKSPVPPPKKKETDPLVILSQEVTTILNVIAPKTFDHFCQQLLDLQLKNTAMLDKLVELIFEKAIHDTAFVEMYAELCLQLKERSQWIFFTIVKHNEEYFWVRDFSFPEEAFAGPYYARQEALAAFANEEEVPAMKPLTISASNLKHTEIILANNHFLKLVQKDGGEWYVTAIPDSQVAIEQRSQVLFSSEKEAVKDATTELSFRGRLAHSCEIEFQKSVKDDTLFDGVDEEYKQLKAKKATLTQEQYEAMEADILDRRSFIKKRMLANIRFVGELYKKKLLNTETMHDCVTELLGHPPQWKATYEEEDLELLCDLLSTVGETLESKTKKMKKEKADYTKRIDQYFEKLKLLSKDKGLIARIRFRIEGVIDLRNNGWVKRAGNAIASVAPDLPSKEEARPGSQRGGPAPSSSAAPRILTREGASQGGDRYGGRPTSQRDPYDNRGPAPRSGDVRDLDRYSQQQGGRYGGNNSYDDRRGGGGGREDDRSSGRYGGRNEPPSAKPTTAAAPSSSGKGPSTTALPTEEAVNQLEFTEASVRRSVVVSVDEVLSGVEVSELKAMLKESSFAHTGYFIQVLLEKYANTSSTSTREKLLGLLEDGELAAWLVSHRNVVERAVEVFEPLQQLGDTTVDIVQAPESYGTVIGRLLKLDAVHFDRLQKMIEKWKQLHAEMLFPEDQLEQIFSRFLSKLR